MAKKKLHNGKEHTVVARYFDGRKAIDLWGDNLDGWTILSGDEKSTDADYYKLIPTLFRAVQLRSYAVSTMPFEILKGKAVYDSSADWQNKVGFLPNPVTMLQLVESALVMCGRAYLFRDRNQVLTKLLRYHIPTSVQLDDKSTPDDIIFKRVVNNVPVSFSDEDYIYFWPPDPFVEFGPAIDYPAKAAANACGVLKNIDAFAASFFERGAIKATLLKVTGMPLQSDREKLESWWQRIAAGVKNAFSAHVINADAVEPVVIGEGMKELENVTVGQEKREDISVAVGIPMSILFANAANYATSKQDELNFLTKTIIPECEFISSVLNEQLFTPLGLHFNFLPETLDAMQEDEQARAQALSQLVTALADPIAEIGMSILGYEIDEEDMAKLQKLWAEKQKRAEDLAKQMSAKPAVENDNNQEDEQSAEGQINAPASPQEGRTDTQEDKNVYTADLEKWRRKALNALKRGKSPAVTFDSLLIPANMYQTITERLKAANDEPTIRAAFVVEGVTTQTDTLDFTDLISELRETRKALVEA